MDLHNANAYTRRVFLKQGAVLASAAVTIPAFLDRAALALAAQQGGLRSAPGVPEERILVVVQLGGGNDGLNTVVPYSMREYYNGRPAIGIAEKEVLRLGDTGVGLHPRMAGLKDLYDAGMLSVIQGVGYPNPNRSHFMSMDIWHTADHDGTGDGWIGKYFDNECKGKPDAKPESGIAIGAAAPLAMQGRLTKPIAFETPELFRWTGQDVDKDLAPAFERLAASSPAEAGMANNSTAAFLMRTALDAQVSSAQIRKAVAAAPLAQYPNSELARELRMIAAMIRSGLKTRVYYATLGGFDTHAGQGGANGRHANLLQEYAQSLKAFYDDLKAQGNDGRVLTMTFSEFGRRVRQNASGGTDHGAAAPMFLAGPMVRPGVLSKHPSLTDLDDGDVKFGVDFRAVYADVLKSWMKADPVKVLGRGYAGVAAIKA